MTVTDPTTTEAISAAIEAISAAVEAISAVYADAISAVSEAYTQLTTQDDRLSAVYADAISAVAEAVAYTRRTTTGDPMTRLTDVDGPEGLSEADLATIAARADAATPGPWWAWDRGVGWHIATEDPDATADVPALLPEGIRTDLGRREDAVFIAHARQDIPRLLAEVRRLRAHHEHCAWGACD